MGLLISCICGIVLVELKLLQVLCNRLVKKKKIVVLKLARKEKKELIAAVKKRH